MLRDSRYNGELDPELQEQVEEFSRQLEQATEFYEKAILFYTAARVQPLMDVHIRRDDRERGLRRVFQRWIQWARGRVIRLFFPRRRLRKVWQSADEDVGPITIIDVTPVDPEQDLAEGYAQPDSGSTGS